MSKKLNIRELSSWIAETFELDKKEVEDCIIEYFNELDTEEAFTKANKFEQEDIDNEQEDLTNSQM